jgi:hypothetical protein
MASGYSDLSEIRKNDVYARHHRPAKINLISERPRRESLVEQQLSTSIPRTDLGFDGGVQRTETWSETQNYRPTTSSFVHSSTTSRDYGPFQGAEESIVSQRSVSSSYAAATRTGTGGSSDQSYGLTLERNQLAELENDLAQKEARLKREIAHLNQQLSPWARPRVIREPRREPEPRSSRSQQRWVKECPSTPSSRPTSRASSTRSNTEAELMEKASKLVQTAEELEKKPLKTQMILIENGARRRVESPTKAESSGVSSVHTAIIKVPNHEVDNKSPLPVAFDNFSTLGVRGNLASIGAAPPETPYPPIFPVVKRTPSPADNRREKR